MIKKIKSIFDRAFKKQEVEVGHSIAGYPEGWPKTSAEFEVFWNNKEAKEFYFDPKRLAFYQEIISLLPSKLGQILDIGCGNGFLLNEITGNARFIMKNITGIDFAESSLVEARKLLPKGKFIKADAILLPFSDKAFNTILIIETLEHLEKWKQALKEAWRVLAPGGRLIITIPDGQIDHWRGHTNFWDRQKFRKNLSFLVNPNVILRTDEGRTLFAILIKPKKQKVKH